MDENPITIGTGTLNTKAHRNLSGERLLSALAGIERWSDKLLERCTSGDTFRPNPHAVLKLRAHSRRLEVGLRVHCEALADLRLDELRAASLALIGILSPARALVLQADAFRASGDALGRSPQGRACLAYALHLDRRLRGGPSAELREALDRFEWSVFRGISGELSARCAAAGPFPPQTWAEHRCAGYEANAYEALRPLLIEGRLDALDRARGAVRDLRYAIKAHRPCFEPEFYTLNHNHAHRLQALVSGASDLETWILEAQDFAQDPFGRKRGVATRVWYQVLRYIWGQRLNYLQQIARHPLVRTWLAQAGERPRIMRSMGPVGGGA